MSKIGLRKHLIIYAVCTKGEISKQWWVELVKIAFGIYAHKFTKLQFPSNISIKVFYWKLAKNIFEQ